jgi:hypothetical protein
MSDEVDRAKLFASLDRLTKPAPWLGNTLLRCAASLAIGAAALAIALLGFGHFLPVTIGQIIALHFVGRLGGWIITVMGMLTGFTLAALGYGDWWWMRSASGLMIMLVLYLPQTSRLRPPHSRPPDHRSADLDDAARPKCRKPERSSRLPIDHLKEVYAGRAV